MRRVTGSNGTAAADAVAVGFADKYLLVAADIADGVARLVGSSVPVFVGAYYRRVTGNGFYLTVQHLTVKLNGAVFGGDIRAHNAAYTQ